MAAPGFPNQKIKVLEIPIGQEFDEPDEWILHEVHSIDSDKGVFYGLFLKRDQAYLDAIERAKRLASARSGVREGKSFEIPKGK